MGQEQTSPSLHASGAPGESLVSVERLRRRADYLRCYRKGHRRQGALAMLYFSPNRLGYPRLGMTASRKVGGAVVRNRLRRRTREIYRRWDKRALLPAVDLVVHLRPQAADEQFGALQEDLLRLFGGLVKKAGG